MLKGVKNKKKEIKIINLGFNSKINFCKNLGQNLNNYMQLFSGNLKYLKNIMKIREKVFIVFGLPFFQKFSFFFIFT